MNQCMNQTANRFVDESKKMSASTVNNFCMDNNYLLYFFSNCLRGYGTPPCCYVLFVEIENKIRCNFINSFVFFKLLMNSIAQWVKGFNANLLVMSSNPAGNFKFLTFKKVFKRVFG